MDPEQQKKILDARKKAAAKASDTRSRAAARRMTSHSRFIASVPAAGLFIAAVALSIVTFIDVISMLGEMLEGTYDLTHIGAECIEFADSFLLSVALYILSLGLICLFVSDKIPLPAWLEFHDFDDLKERLASVICIMLGVYFMGYTLNGDASIDTLWLGLGSAAVIFALAYFVRHVFLHKEAEEEDEEEPAGE